MLASHAEVFRRIVFPPSPRRKYDSAWEGDIFWHQTSHLLSGLQTVVRCTQNTAGQALFFFAEFDFARILQNAGKTSSTPKHEKTRLMKLSKHAITLYGFKLSTY